MLEKILTETPDPEYLVENRKTQEEAAQLLKDWAGR
jgi:predicted RNase H-like HicB family nuclease